MDPAVFEALEHCLSGNRAPGWARRLRAQRARRAYGVASFEASGLLVPQQQRDAGESGKYAGSLGSPEGLFGRSHSRLLSPMHASRVSYHREGSQLAKVRRRPSSSPATSPVSTPSSPVSPPRSLRKKTPSVAVVPSQAPLPADFLEQPWVQRYLNETKGLLSVLTLENIAARWELERANPEEAKAQAKARAERTPAAQARRRKREQHERQQARLERQREKEATRIAHLQAERQEQIYAAEKVAAEIAAATAAASAGGAAAAGRAETEAAATVDQLAAVAEQRDVAPQRLFEAAATMIQKMYRGKARRAQHEALLRTPIVVVSIIGGIGSGKTTLCQRLVADGSLRRIGVSLCHLSTGSLLRQVARPRSKGVDHPQAELIRVMMEGGEPVPTNIVCDILQKEITKFRYRAGRYADSPRLSAAPQINLVLLDGFPINVEQANMLQETPLASVRSPDCAPMSKVLLVVFRKENT